MYIRKLQIENLRAFASTELTFNVPGDEGMDLPNVNVLLGDNGLGKTSVLRAAALATLGPLLSGSSGFVSDGLVRHAPTLAAKDGATPRPARLTAEVLSGDSETRPRQDEPALPEAFELRTDIQAYRSAEMLKCRAAPQGLLDAIEHHQFDDTSPAFFMVGYGANRRVESSALVDESARLKSRARRYARVGGLFEDHMSMIPLSYWLPAFATHNKGRHRQVITLINKLLPDNCRIQATPSETSDGLQHLFDMNGIDLPFRALSDGFRAYIGWIGDMLFHICQGVRPGQMLKDTEGVVMVDEIDLHLHPEWQRTVVPALAAALPNIQFILTTHSPLVVGSLTSQNLFLLHAEDGASVVQRLPEPVRGKSADQILLSPWFGLDSTRSQEGATQLRNLARSAMGGDSEAAIAYLKAMAPVLGLVDESGKARPAVRKGNGKRRGKKIP